MKQKINTVKYASIITVALLYFPLGIRLMKKYGYSEKTIYLVSFSAQIIIVLVLAFIYYHLQ
jgi:hypothetical protein